VSRDGHIGQPRLDQALRFFKIRFISLDLCPCSASSLALPFAALNLAARRTSAVVFDFAHQEVHRLPTHAIGAVRKMCGCYASEGHLANPIAISTKFFDTLRRVPWNPMSISLVEGVSKESASKQLGLDLLWKFLDSSMHDSPALATLC
jgi:hypothetical protein